MPEYAYFIDNRNWSKRRNKVERAIYSEVSKGMRSLAIGGRDEMRKAVKNKGTDFSRFRQSLGLGSKGRVRTGRMYNSISWLYNKGGGYKSIKYTVGFIKGAFEAYYYYQEYGFRNVWKFSRYSLDGKSSGPNAEPGFIFKYTPGGYTEGMFALKDARQKIKDLIPNIAKVVKNAIKRRVNK